MNLKHLVAFVSSLILSTSAYIPNISHCSKVWNNYMVQVVSGRSLPLSCCTSFGQLRRNLVNNSIRHGLD